MGNAATVLKVAKQFSARRNVNRRIFRFSVVIGTAGMVLSAVLLIVSIYPSIEKAQEVNRRALAEISCSDTGCDNSALTTDWQVSDAIMSSTHSSHTF